MQFSQRDGSNIVIGRQIDDNRRGLPLFGGEGDGFENLAQLREEGLTLVEVNWQGDDLFQRMFGQRFDLRLLFGGEGWEKLRRIMGFSD